MPEKIPVQKQENILERIKLPDDPAWIKKLERKLDEYRERLEKKRLENSNLDRNSFTTTIYKIALLANLLSEHEIVVEDIARKLSDQYGGINRKDFDKAVFIIFDNATTGGNLTKPGMGLKKEIEEVE